MYTYFPFLIEEHSRTSFSKNSAILKKLRSWIQAEVIRYRNLELSPPGWCHWRIQKKQKGQTFIFTWNVQSKSFFLPWQENDWQFPVPWSIFSPTLSKLDWATIFEIKQGKKTPIQWMISNYMQKSPTAIESLLNTVRIFSKDIWTWQMHSSLYTTWKDIFFKKTRWNRVKHGDIIKSLSNCRKF